MITKKCSVHPMLFVCGLFLTAVVSSTSVIAGPSSLSRAFSGWFWLGRSTSANNLPQLSFLMRVTGCLSGDLRCSATPAPQPIPAGNSLQQVARMPWRMQPEIFVRIRRDKTRVDYHVQETGYSPQCIKAQGRPDLEEVTDCLFNSHLSHIPLWLDNVHSLPGILSGILLPRVRQGRMGAIESGGVFVPELVVGRRLESISACEPSMYEPDHFMFAEDEFLTHYPVYDQPDDRAIYEQDGVEFLQIGATPHTGSLSVFHWGQEILVMTVDAAGHIVMLASHRLLLFLGWFSGGCKPDEDLSEPESWDPDNYPRQVNSLPGTNRAH